MPRKHSIRYLSSAERDLRDIVDYLISESPSGALHMIEAFDAAVSRLADFPLSAPAVTDPLIKRLDYRVLTVESYLIFYVVKKGAVEIRRILHGARNYEFLFKG